MATFRVVEWKVIVTSLARRPHGRRVQHALNVNARASEGDIEDLKIAAPPRLRRLASRRRHRRELIVYYLITAEMMGDAVFLPSLRVYPLGCSTLLFAKTTLLVMVCFIAGFSGRVPNLLKRRRPAGRQAGAAAASDDDRLRELHARAPLRRSAKGAALVRARAAGCLAGRPNKRSMKRPRSAPKRIDPKLELTLLEHPHHLEALDRCPCRSHRLEAERRPDQAFSSWP